MSAYSEFVVDLQNGNSSWRKVFDLVSARSRVLDVGCNSGYFAKVLIEQKGCHVDGVEIDPGDADRARTICSTVFEGDVEEPTFVLYKVSHSYDFVVCLDIIEHLRNPAIAIQRFARLLKPEGKLVFSIPNMANGSVRLGLLQGMFDYQHEGLLDETHLHFYTLEAICKLVEESGLHWHGLTHTAQDVTPEAIERCLEQVGLNSSAEFVDYLNSGESVVYQYIGTLGVNQPTGECDPHVAFAGIEPTSYYADVLASVQAESRQVFNNMVTLAEEDSRKAAYILQLEQSLAAAAAMAAVSSVEKSLTEGELQTCGQELLQVQQELSQVQQNLLQVQQEISAKTFAAKLKRLVSLFTPSHRN